MLKKDKDQTTKEELENKISQLRCEIERLKSSRIEKIKKADKKFIELADLLPETVYMTDALGKATFINQTGINLFGPLPDGKSTPFHFFIPEDRNRAKKNLSLRLQGISGKPTKYTALTKKNRPFPVMLHSNPVMENNLCAGTIGLIVDISFQKNAENALRASEEKYRDILESISDFWYSHDLDGNFIETNFVFKNEFQFKEKDIEGLNVKDLLTERYRQEFENYMKEILETGKSEGYTSISVKNGHEAIYEYKNTLVYKKGRPIMVRGASKDITERIQAEKALKKSEERYRSVFENAGLPTMIIDDDMTVSMVNPKFEEFTGYSKNEVEGRKKFPEFVSERDRDRMKKYHKSREKGKNASIEYDIRVILRRGEADVLMRVGIIPDTGQIVASFTDITNLKMEEEALRESKEYLQKENFRLRSSIKERYRFGNIIGKSMAMQEVYEFILNAVGSDANVIIYGESGTGKELVARAVHDMSDRSTGEFVAVNCGAIPENIIESEFFGYRKGAFTGADMDKPGFLDIADKGTLFLDELGEISLNMQVKLLRAIEGGGYTPIGSSQLKKSDFRIVSATNKNLSEHVKNGYMREDFFYRIHIIPFRLPPLRKRKEDIPLLIDHFLEKYANGNEIPTISGKVFDALNNYDWPGNVRELQNTLYRYITLKKLDFMESPARDDKRGIVSEDVAADEFSDLYTAVNDFEKASIEKALNRHHWHRGRTASFLRLNRKTLFIKMKKHGLI